MIIQANNQSEANRMSTLHVLLIKIVQVWREVNSNDLSVKLFFYFQAYFLLLEKSQIFKLLKGILIYCPLYSDAFLSDMFLMNMKRSRRSLPKRVHWFLMQIIWSEVIVSIRHQQGFGWKWWEGKEGLDPTNIFTQDASAFFTLVNKSN